MNRRLPDHRITTVRPPPSGADMEKPIGSFYEFFAGGGMARAGLGPKWSCLFANDIDSKKGASYAANWSHKNLRIADVAQLRAADLPGQADLAWASFPCQDLSLAGNHAGLKGKRSGTFWPFWKLIEALTEENRAPSLVVLENVCGALASHDGKDFDAISAALAATGYRFGALVIDAAHFVPQSRPRLFIIAVRKDRPLASDLASTKPNPVWHPSNLVNARGKLSSKPSEKWLWWRLPEPAPRQLRFADVIEHEPQGVSWHGPEYTQRLLRMMSSINREKVDNARAMQRPTVGAIYRRTRLDEAGKRVQRAEIRFDDVAGCLRTPAGGSSRQSVLIVEGQDVRSRLLSPREAARLMGLPDKYKLPENYNEAYHLSGDGVVVPVVRFIAAHLLEPLLAAETRSGRGMA
jgi:DNA (cytosine-5)-methyltransferase 1